MSSKKINRKSFFIKTPKNFLNYILNFNISKDLSFKNQKTEPGKKIKEEINQKLKIFDNFIDPIKLQYNEVLKNIQPELQKYFNEPIWVRPPGSILDEKDFENKCTQCGDCSEICPNQAILNVEGLGPLINPNSKACLLCEDYPCINSCKTGALIKLNKKEIPSFGKAKLIEEFCLNTKINVIKNVNTSNKNNKNIEQNFCNICEKTCPIKNAVYLDEKNYKPIFTDYCSGCGICKENCPSDGGEAIMIMSD